MYDGRDKLVPISEEKFDELIEKEVNGVFRVGDYLEIKGVKFRIHNINKFGMKLRVIPKDELK